jgi:hypothetical protein
MLMNFKCVCMLLLTSLETTTSEIAKVVIQTQIHL